MTLQELQALDKYELEAAILDAGGGLLLNGKGKIDHDRLFALEDKLLQDGTQKLAWLNNLRKVLEPSAPKNKVGAPIISDYDLLRMTGRRRAEAYYLTLTK